MEIDLSKSVEAKMQEMISSGKLDKIITTKIEDMVNSAVSDVFSSYGDVAKQFKELIKKNIKLDFDKVDFAEYNHNMSLIVKNKVESILTTEGSKKFQEAMDYMLKDGIPARMKLSELVEKFKEDIYIDDGSCGDISFDISESSHGYYHISMDEAEGKSPYSCKYRIMVNEKDEKVALVTIDGKKWDNKLILGGLYGFDAFMFKVYSAGMTVEKDVDQVDTHYGHDED